MALPDLSVVTAPQLTTKFVFAGTRVLVEIEVYNLGDALSLGSTTAGIYLSTDSIIDSADTQLTRQRRHREPRGG